MSEVRLYRKVAAEEPERRSGCVNTQELDRLVTKTELNPFVKLALRRVRKAIATGDVTSLSISKRSWSVTVCDPRGLSCKWVFTLKDSNGNK